jgi:sugar lactone lactonase YvrE
VWITVSTRKKPRALGYRRDAADGFIVLADRKGARIVADGLGFTNEVAVDPRGDWLWVNETFARKLSRFRIVPDGTLGPKEVVTSFGEGTYPDGLAFDAEGHVWIVSIVSNRVLRVAPDGTPTVILEDSDAAHMAWTEAAYIAGEMGRPHLDRAAGRFLKNTSSIAFGGPDLRTAYLGCLLDTRLPTFRAPVAGHPPPHWQRRTRMFDNG